MSDDEFGDFDIELNEDTLKALQDTEDRYSLTTASQAYVSQQPVVSTSAPARPAVATSSRPAFANGNTTSFSSSSHASPHSSTPGVTHGDATSLRGSTTLPAAKPMNASGPPSRGGFMSRANQPGNQTQTTRTAPPLGGFIRGSQKSALNNGMEIDPPSNNSGPPRPSAFRPSQSFSHAQTSNSETERLRAQIRELQALKNSALKQLEQERSAQFVRNGEIATLRRSMEKQAAAHTEAIEKLRAEKLDAEKKRAAVEMEMTQEMDRLKTRFSFKQQEYETAALRAAGAPPSTGRRGKRFQASQQPTPGPSRYQSSQLLGRGPTRSFSEDVPGGITTPLMSQKVTSRANASRIEPIPFAGFNDAFSSKPTAQEKGRGRPGAPSTSASSTHAPLNPSFSDPFVELDAPAATPNHNLDRESEVAPPEANPTELDTPTFRWSDELFRVMFTCAAPSANSEPTLAVQVLLSTSFADAAPELDHFRNSYRSACSSLLELVSRMRDDTAENGPLNPEENEEYQRLVNGIGVNLLTIIDALLRIDPNQHEAIYSAIYLISSLILLLPSFCNFFLNISVPRSLSLMLGQILDTYQPEKRQIMSEPVMSRMILEDRVGAAALSLIEILTWNGSDASCACMNSFVGATSCLSNLVVPSQPLWLVSRAIRLLVLFSTRSTIAPHLLPTTNEDDGIDYTTSIECICGYLAEPSSIRLSLARPNLPPAFAPKYKELWDLITLMLAYLTELAIVPEGCMRLLERFPFLVPSLILCMADIADQIWELDNSLSEAPSTDHDALVYALSCGLQLLHRLFYSAGYPAGSEIPAYADLPHILTQVGGGDSQPLFNALDHTYIVTMARMGYADVPEWLGTERVRVVDDVAELARELLELYVGGPEGDLIIEAYVPASPDDAQPNSPSAGGNETAMDTDGDGDGGETTKIDDDGETTEEE